MTSDAGMADQNGPSESSLMKALLYREIDHGGARGAAIHEIREQVAPLLEGILLALHDARALRAGEQWTLPVALSCGFEAEVVFRVADPGPDHAAARRLR